MFRTIEDLMYINDGWCPYQHTFQGQGGLGYKPTPYNMVGGTIEVISKKGGILEEDKAEDYLDNIINKYSASANPEDIDKLLILDNKINEAQSKINNDDYLGKFSSEDEYIRDRERVERLRDKINFVIENNEIMSEIMSKKKMEREEAVRRQSEEEYDNMIREYQIQQLEREQENKRKADEFRERKEGIKKEKNKSIIFENLKKPYEVMKEKEKKANEFREIKEGLKKEKNKEKAFEGWRRLNLDLPQESGYNFFHRIKNNNLDKLENRENGKAFEELEVIAPEINTPLKKFVGKDDDIKSLETEAEKKLNPNIDTEIEWLKQHIDNLNDELNKNHINETEDIKDVKKGLKTLRDKDQIKGTLVYMRELIRDELINNNKNDSFKYPWETIPVDNFSKSHLDENKNYIHTNNWSGEKIDNIEFKNIQRMKDKEGMTPEMIEKKYKDEGKKMPFIYITEGKLTGLNKNDKTNHIQLKFKKNPVNNSIFVDSMNYRGLLPDRNNKLNMTFNHPLFKFTNDKKLIYDLLYDNGRVFYSPLEDSNAKLINGQITLPYDRELVRGVRVYKVPYSRAFIRKPETRKI